MGKVKSLTVADVVKMIGVRDRHTMNERRLNAYRPQWKWKSMVGSTACIKWCFRDLQNLDAALGLFNGRNLAVQAGGNLGIFAKRLAEEFTTVHSFEPSSELIKACRINAPEKNIVFHEVALGEISGAVSLSAERRNGTRPGHEGLTHVAGDGHIPMRTIDSFHFAACNLIYLDIEGFELKALRGALDTINRCRPVIAVEINHNINYYGESDEDLRGFLFARGYQRMVVMNSDEVFVPEETLR